MHPYRPKKQAEISCGNLFKTTGNVMTHFDTLKIAILNEGTRTMMIISMKTGHPKKMAKILRQL
jgi:hypothetical protein